MAPAVADPNNAFGQFATALKAALRESDGFRLTLGKYDGDEAELRRIGARLISVQGTPCLSVVLSYLTRDITKNWPLADAVRVIMDYIKGGFRHAHLVTATEDIQLAANRRGIYRFQRGRSGAGPRPDVAPDDGQNMAHDRAKRRMLDLDRPFLAALGIVSGEGKLVPAMAAKWKQVNRFLEIVSHAMMEAGLTDLERRGLDIVDFGSGKGYLTFALHDHLRTQGIEARVTGIEQRGDLVGLCNGVVAKLGIQGLNFQVGSIAQSIDVSRAASQRVDVVQQAPIQVEQPTPAKPALPGGRIDILIALHACDTATDEAMALGVRAGASVIVCSPCCHKELRLQIKPPAALKPLLKHGVHLGQEAEMLTDGLRALLLEAQGYATQVFEFVSLEHTGKNKMILAVKRPGAARREAVRQQIDELKLYYGVREQHLEHLLQHPDHPRFVVANAADAGPPT